MPKWHVVSSTGGHVIGHSSTLGASAVLESRVELVSDVDVDPADCSWSRFHSVPSRAESQQEKV